MRAQTRITNIYERKKFQDLRGNLLQGGKMRLIILDDKQNF
jgi:hypothetical protein